jgi:hypothetical protein
VRSPPIAAELLDDGGQAAASEEFFRSHPFLEAEGATHTLLIGDLAAPLVVREIPGDTALRDAVSPYGYPGIEARRGGVVDPSEVDFKPTGLVSIFIRHRLGESPLAGARERGQVQIADPGLAPKSRMSDRQQIRRNERRGLRVELVRGPESSAAQRSGFFAAYTETMRRTEAGERYFFDRAYFDRILSSARTWLCLASEPGGELAAGSVVASSDGSLHYYLSGTADRFLRSSPMKNVVAALVDFAQERQLPLNLGGGIEPGDALEEFKRGFANRAEPWLVSEIVCDREAYERLSGTREAGFFPAYRAP